MANRRRQIKAKAKVRLGRIKLRADHHRTDPCSCCMGFGWVSGCPACGARWRKQTRRLEPPVHP